MILELSGIADPRRVIPWAGSDGFRLDAVVVLVDVDQFLTRVDDPLVGATVQAQLAAADLFVLSKTDLADSERVAEVRARLDTDHPQVPVFVSGTAEATAALLQTATRRPGGFADVPDSQLFDAHEVSLVPVPNPLPTDALDALLDDLPDDVLRAKAVIGLDSGVAVQVHVVGHRRTITPLSDAEAQAVTDLVVIRPRSGYV